MDHAVVRWTVTVALAGATVAPASFAQESPKPLPTLLIKGEVVSVDTNDPTAVLLKVKDRYGFETPIYLSQETKIAQGDQALTTADLSVGAAVEVEYNFDINTAKRHAVNVAVSAPPATATPAPAAPEVPVSGPEAIASPAAPEAPAATAPSPEPSVTPAAAPSSEPVPAAPAAPVTKEHPGKEHPGETTP